VEQAIPCAQQHGLYAVNVPPTRGPVKEMWTLISHCL
jgi:hypothetical protein